MAPYLLLLSVAARMGVTYVVPNGTNLIDLHVYVDGAATIANGGLYDFVYHPRVPPLDLRFTYPPFAALLFYPLHLLPFSAVAASWQLGIVAALYGCSVLALRMVGQHDNRLSMAWTAVAIWFEPMRHVFELGQIGVFLMLAVLLAVTATRSATSGLLVGLAAGVKLTPGIAGLYYLGGRRWPVVLVSAVTFCATVAVSVALLGEQGLIYFTDLVGDAGRIGIVDKPDNQSLRGVVGYVLGYDAGYGPAVLVAVAVALALGVFAWRAVDRADGLGRVLVVMLFGLLISPISWTHHWVWVLPLIIWLRHGPRREITRAAGSAWLALALIGPPWIVTFTDARGWTNGQWYLSWVGSLYVVATLVTFGYLATTRRPVDRSRAPAGDPAP